MTLKGGLGPALLPENLADKADYELVGVIKYGRETLAMPGWDGILNTAEIEWLVAQLKQGNFVELNNREKK
jgi:cytochrome c55X